MQDSVENRGNQLSRARILVADDNTAILAHVSEMLQADYELIGIEIARQLHEQGYAGVIVFLTVHEDPDFVTAAIGAGGQGYVIKSRMNADLGLAVKAALSHRIFISPPLQEE
jgi:CheY-like chemotaxis protein